MARKKPGMGAPFQGRWRIVSMELWAKEDIDLVEPGFIEFDAAKGEMCFIAVRAWLDVRYDIRERQPLAEFSWEGVDEGDQRCGRGWVALEAPGRIAGRLFFHQGDDSGFVCEPW